MDAFKLNHIVLKTEAHKLAERANRLGNQKISVHTDMTKYESRLRTYKEWPLSFISAKQMSKAGFYYYGKQDNVKCEFCSIELGYWQRGEDPTDEHKKKSPHCAYFKENEGYDVCGLYGCPSFELSSNIEYKELQEFLYAAGIVIKINPPEYKHYSALTARLDTFKKWDINEKPDIQTLCEAGFFYSGRKSIDELTCFCCDRHLNNWDKTDEPWTEHARWSPTCSFLLLNKGKMFVDEASCMINNVSRINYNILFKLITMNIGEVAPVSESDTIVNTVENQLSSIRITEEDIIEIERNGLLEKQQQYISIKQEDNAAIDPMLCKICYRDQMRVVFLPCAHLFACIQCAIIVDQCAVCRYPFTLAMTVNIYMNQILKDYIVNCSPYILPPGFKVPDDLMLCKVCHKEDLGSAFVPCKHIYACTGCAKNMDVCPVCTTDVITIMQVYI